MIFKPLRLRPAGPKGECDGSGCDDAEITLFHPPVPEQGSLLY
jgi:hypothetical protein